MIKVIEHGPKTIKARCPKCGCIFEYELEDVKNEMGLGFEGYSYNYVECPDCKYHVYHDYFKLEEPKEPRVWYSTEPIPCFKPGIYPTDLESHSVCQSSGCKFPEDVEIHNINSCEDCPAYGQTYRLGESPCNICSEGKKLREE